MTTLVTTTLEVGLAAILLQAGDGLAAKISHVALGDAAYTPAQTQAGLRNERARFSVAGGKVVGPRQFHVAAKADGPTEFWVREVGFVLSDGTFLAVWSDPVKPLAYKAPGVDLLLGFDLLLSGIPAGSVVIEATGDLNLSMAEEFATMAKALVDLQHISVKQFVKGALK
ncbi:phage tail protein [Mitsuaria sp. GD03876]|uniref:phage tail-collar fiber domain-containing protein n=1 Tax=Mitsuaria sp. GD03876 TaxID=2975399 RepID=UPI002447679C|nr:phage tail protein [Mitsuaria sp. GD03876]MDH0866455.1 phage tail protein [Mitsuaria sp. GD03876]